MANIFKKLVVFFIGVVVATSTPFAFGDNKKTGKEVTNEYFSTIKSFTIEGNKNLSYQEIEAIVKPYLNKDFTPKIEEILCEKIHQKYEEKGYIFSFVSDIQNKNGHLDIIILEGYIREIIYDKAFDQDPIFKFCIEKLKEIKPYNQNQASFYFGLLKSSSPLIGKLKLSSHVVYPLSSIDPQNPALVDLIIVNFYYGVSGILSLDNRYKSDYSKEIKSSPIDAPLVEYKGSNFAQIAVNFNNYLKKGEKITLAYITSGDREDQSISARMEYPLNYLGTKFLADISFNDSPVSNEQKISFITLGVKHPLYLTYYKNLTASIELQKYHEKQRQYSARSRKRIAINKAIVGLNYVDSKYNYQVNTAFHQSITDNKKVSAVTEFGNDKHFNKITFGSDVTYDISKGYEFIARISAQYSKYDLLFAEVFNAGVYKGGRGFSSGEIYGDKGASLSLEFAKNTVVNNHPLFRTHREYVYFDNSLIWNNIEDEYKAKQGQISSVGIGTEITVTDNISFNLEFALPLTEKLKGSRVRKKSKPKSRIFAGVDYIFAF